LRVIEFPRYGDFAESFPNTIPFSEGIGFITYVDPSKKDAINLPFSSPHMKSAISGGRIR
jgi:ABC-2 type transport system permease protein